jgi:hypothetical protein
MTLAELRDKTHLLLDEELGSTDYFRDELLNTFINDGINEFNRLTKLSILLYPRQCFTEINYLYTEEHLRGINKIIGIYSTNGKLMDMVSPEEAPNVIGSDWRMRTTTGAPTHIITEFCDITTPGELDGDPGVITRFFGYVYPKVQDDNGDVTLDIKCSEIQHVTLENDDDVVPVNNDVLMAIAFYAAAWSLYKTDVQEDIAKADKFLGVYINKLHEYGVENYTNKPVMIARSV